MTRRAGVYVRISEDRSGAGLGVDRQREDCERLAETLGWHVVDTYVDNDISAFSGKRRPAYDRLIEDLDAGRIDAVLCWHTDRLHRSPRELEDYVSLAERRKITTMAVTAGELDLATPSGRMVARILGSVARQEIEHKIERTRRAHLQAAQQGRWRGGGRPFGYEADGVTVREDEAAEVRRLYDAVIAGQTLGALVRDLNARGITSTTGKRWEFTTLRQMLLKARNAGLSVYRDEVQGLGRWPALVPESTWREAAAVLNDPGRRTSASNRTRWLLAGLAVCGACGTPVRSGAVVSNRATGATRTVYRCRTAGRGHVARSAEPVDELVTTVILERLRRPDAAALLEQSGGPDVSALVDQEKALHARLDQLTELFADGVLTKEQLATATGRLRQRLADVQGTLNAQRRHPTARRFADPGSIARGWDVMDIAARREVVALLVDVRLLPQGRRGNAFDPAGVEITWRTS